ncbi:MAG: hypothetical protein H6898_03600 [Rhodobacter sp.]|nr:hypothetical protein [Paracoccaceae bacterium]MCC0075651.1 hypothetical protein [Rhodobacter sp.]
MTFSRALSLIGLVLALATGSVTMAMARHQVHAVQQVVICTGYGLVAIALDEDGNPTGPVLPCPDSVPAVTAMADDGIPPYVVAPQALIPVRYDPRNLAAPAVAPLRHRQSRAPPVPV